MDLANKIKVSLFFLAIIISCYFAVSVKGVSDRRGQSEQVRKYDKSVFDNAYFSSFDLLGKKFVLGISNFGIP